MNSCLKQPEMMFILLREQKRSRINHLEKFAIRPYYIYEVIGLI